MKFVIAILLISATFCQLVNEAGTNVWKEKRVLAQLPQHEVTTLEVKASAYLNFDFPDDSTDGGEWSVKGSRELKLLMLIGQGHVYPSAQTGTTIHRRTYSFQAKTKGQEDVIFINAVPGKEAEGKTYTIKFTIV